MHYVVLNNGQNVWNMEIIERLIEIYDTIDKSTGPGVVVTIGTGAKFFCTGFDL